MALSKPPQGPQDVSIYPLDNLGHFTCTRTDLLFKAVGKAQKAQKAQVNLARVYRNWHLGQGC
jgi:hypothetical protein